MTTVGPTTDPTTPHAAAAAAPAPAPASASPAAPTWRVVVVDDSPDDRAEARRLLLQGSGRRYRFIEAETAAAAVAAVLADPPDCLLLDYNLPDQNAPDVLTALAGPAGLTACPVVVITGGTGAEFGRAVLRAGAQDYIGKDWLTPEALTRAVENAAERWAMAHELKGREAELRASEERYRVLADALPHMTWVTRPDHTVEYANRLHAAYTGLSVDELNAVGWPSLVHPDDRDRLLAEVAGPLARGEPHEAEYRLRWRDGTYRWVFTRAVPVTDPAGRVERWVGTTTDVDARKRAEEALRASEAFARHLADVAPSVLYIYDLVERRNVWGNREMFTSLGYDTRRLESLAGDLVGSLMHPDDLPAYAAHADRLSRLADGEVAELEYRFRRADGRWIWFLSRDMAFRRATDGRVTQIIGSALDMTDRKAAEAALSGSLADTQTLHRLATNMARPGEPQEFYERLMDAAVEVMGSDFASMQMLHPERGRKGGKGELKLLASRGFPPEAARHWEWVQADSTCSCGLALASGAPVGIHDTAADPRVAGADRETYVAAGIRAVQTTPLVTRDGRLLGAISTHWKTPHTPSERDWRLFDVLVRHAADLLERVQAEEALRSSEERFRSLVDLSPQFVWLADADGSITFCNQWWYEYTGLTQERTVGWAWAEAVHPDHRDRLAALWRQTVDAGGDWNAEIPFRRADGEYRWHLGRGQAVRGADGRVLRWIGIGLDIHDRKQAEQAVRSSETRLQAFYDTPAVGSLHGHVDGRVFSCNDEYLRIIGRSREEVLSGRVRWDEITPAEWLPVDAAAIAEARERGACTPYEKQYLRPDGARVWVLLSYTLLEPAREESMALVIDITGRKEAEAARERALAESERQRATLTAVLEAVPVGITVATAPDVTIVSVNRAGREIAERSREDLTGRPAALSETGAAAGHAAPWQIRRPGCAEIAGDAELPLTRAALHGETVRDEEWCLRSASGREITLSCNAGPVRDDAGNIVAGVIAWADVTDRKEAERALARERERLAAALRTGNLGVYEWDLAADGVWWSSETYPLFGVDPASFVPSVKAFDALVHPEDRAELWRLSRESAEQGTIFVHEYRILRPDGAERWIFNRSQIVRDPSGTPVRVTGVAIDITDRKRAEQELKLHRENLQLLVDQRTAELEATHQRLRLSERMATLGTLSAGLGHDMGNLLVPVRVRLGSLDEQALGDQAREDVKAIRTSAEYLQRLSNGLRLLALDPQRSAAGEVTELAPWWSDTHGVMRTVLPRGVALEADIPAGDCAAAISRPGLTQVVFNLIQNAGDAMKARASGRVRVLARREGERVRLEVSDDGPGMTPEVRARCMEPFFTTKPRGISTGLGLVLVYGLVREARGTVDLQSELGQGTTFVLHLPAALAAGDAKARGGGPRRAAVELNDARLRSLVSRELSSLTYDVKDAAGLDAAAICVLDRAETLARVRTGTKVLYLGETPAVPGLEIRSLGPRPQPSALRAAIRELSG